MKTAFSILFSLTITASLLSGMPQIVRASEPRAVLSGFGPGPGDINGDGHINIFDLLAVLSQVSGAAEPAPGADLDGSGVVDTPDIKALLQIIAGYPPPASGFQFIAAIDVQALCQSEVFLMDFMNRTGEITYPYAVYANREIKEVLFVFNGDTLTGITGDTPPLFNRDTVVLTHPVHGGVDPLSCGIFPWYIRVTDNHGNWRDTTGSAEFKVWFFQGTWDPSYPMVGLPLEFPLTLQGKLQRFKGYYRGAPTDTAFFDLNREQADSVVFPDIDSLAYAVRRSKSVRGLSGLIVSPAYDRIIGEKVNRLYMTTGAMAIMPYISPLDENEALLAKLGFPDWYRNIEQLILYKSYTVYPGWPGVYIYR